MVNTGTIITVVVMKEQEQTNVIVPEHVLAIVVVNADLSIIMEVG